MNARLSKRSSASSRFPKVNSELYRCFLKHLVQPHTPTLKTAEERSITEKAEAVIVKAFSDELTKLGFIGPLLKGLAGPAMKEFGIQLGVEGLGRALGVSNRSPLEVMKDTATGTLFHGALGATGKAIGTMPNGAVKSVANWFQNRAGIGDMLSYSPLGRATVEGLGLGVKTLAKSMSPNPEQQQLGQQSQLGKPQQLTGPSYQQLRATDPRVLSQQYFS